MYYVLFSIILPINVLAYIILNDLDNEYPPYIDSEKLEKLDYQKVVFKTH